MYAASQLPGFLGNDDHGLILYYLFKQSSVAWSCLSNLPIVCMDLWNVLCGIFFVSTMNKNLTSSDLFKSMSSCTERVCCSLDHKCQMGYQAKERKCLPLDAIYRCVHAVVLNAQGSIKK